MSNIIAVNGFPQKTKLAQVVQLLFRPINGQFEALTFVDNPGPEPSKTCYLRLSNKLDPVQIIRNINSSMKVRQLHAYLPDPIPNFVGRKIKGKALTAGQKKTLKYTSATKPHQIVLKSLEEILREIQLKYTGLYNLSRKTQHKLLDNITQIIAERLRVLLRTAQPGDLSFKLTGRYRVAHPHFGDFQLILSTLHRLEDAAGTPRSQIVEQDLLDTPTDITSVNNIPFTRGQEACNKYVDRILQRLNDYVDSYDVSPAPGDTEEDKARKKVQKHIADTMPYLPNIINQAVANHFVPECKGMLKMRMYGEPYLPSKELCLPLLNRHRAGRVTRCSNVFNALLFDLPRDQYAKIMRLDGSNIGPAKIVIRSSNGPVYQAQKEYKAKLTEELVKEFEN